MRSMTSFKQDKDVNDDDNKDDSDIDMKNVDIVID